MEKNKKPGGDGGESTQRSAGNQSSIDLRYIVELFDYASTEYFAFETRVRAMVIELVEPIVKRSVLERETVAEVQQAQDLLKRKLDECEFVVQKAQKKTTNTDDLARQLASMVRKRLWITIDRRPNCVHMKTRPLSS